jgi:adenosylhomocysteinase
MSRITYGKDHTQYVQAVQKGTKKIRWAGEHMPLLKETELGLMKDMSFKNMKIALCIHLEAKTARLCEVLKAGGADMYIAGSNPLSTQDDVAAALVAQGMTVYASHNCSDEQYVEDLKAVLKHEPDIVIDDGGDLLDILHNDEAFAEIADKVKGGCEETTTGVTRLITLQKANRLLFPMVAVNDAMCKNLCDNRYGTGQSVWTAITATTNLSLAGKTAVVAGYGNCGKGVAMRAKGLGMKVIVTEVQSIPALEAMMDGFMVMSMNQAAKYGDFFVTVTGCKDVITAQHFMSMKHGAVCCNAGHFDCEVDVAGLKDICIEHDELRPNIHGYVLENTEGETKRIDILAEGRLVNLAAGDGHPAEIMDVSFTLQTLSAQYIAKSDFNAQLPADAPPEARVAGVLQVPIQIDATVAQSILELNGCNLDTLTRDQMEYITGQPSEEQTSEKSEATEENPIKIVPKSGKTVKSELDEESEANDIQLASEKHAKD